MATLEAHQIKREIRIGWVFFSIFAFLIFLGIFVKRGMGHPEFMMFFHGPAAVFLVLAGRKLTAPLRKRYEEERGA
ncbi:MAG: hypothetical protein H7A33_00780 [Deltaproteobacteria bacterium]|nr:hypothetical protein [Deltaproteobacteria bacterium]